MWPFRKRENRASLNNPSTPISAIFDDGMKSNTGRNVSPDTAMQSTVVFACVQIRAETIASLPLHIYKRLKPAGKGKATDHPLYKVLHERPNPEMTAKDFYSTMQLHLDLRGNAYAEKVFDRGGRLTELWPIIPSRVRAERDKRTQQLQYTVTLPDSGEMTFGRDKIFHHRGLGGDGIMGYSKIKMAKEAIGLSLATEEYGARFFGNGAKPGIILEHPGKLSSNTAKGNIRSSFEKEHGGVSKSHRLMILEEGMKAHQIGLSQEDSQYLQTRNFQGIEICRIFNIPPIMVGLENKSSTYASADQFFLSFEKHTIRPELVGWEQRFRKDLFDEDDTEHFAEFLVAGLLRGDIASRYNAYSIGRNGGWLSADDILEFENMNPLPNGQGKVYLVPLNMVPVDQAGKMNDKGKMPEKMPEDEEEMPMKKKKQMGRAFQRLFQDATTRIIKRERADVIRRAKQFEKGLLTGTPEQIKDYEQWLDGFYEEHREFVKRNISPVIISYIEVFGGDEEEKINEFTERHINNSKKEILSLINDTNCDIETSLKQMFDRWEEKRTIEIAERETVNA